MTAAELRTIFDRNWVDRRYYTGPGGTLPVPLAPGTEDQACRALFRSVAAAVAEAENRTIWIDPWEQGRPLPEADHEPAPVAAVRRAAYGAGGAARCALLLILGELALATLPPGPARDDGTHALDLAARVPAGEQADVAGLLDAIHDEADEGVDLHAQAAPRGPEAQAWTLVVSVLCYATWLASTRQERGCNGLVENCALPETVDWCIDPLRGIPGVDGAVLERLATWVRAYASPADEGWGRPLPVACLRQTLG